MDCRAHWRATEISERSNTLRQGVDRIESPEDGADRRKGDDEAVPRNLERVHAPHAAQLEVEGGGEEEDGESRGAGGDEVEERPKPLGRAHEQRDGRGEGNKGRADADAPEERRGSALHAQEALERRLRGDGEEGVRQHQVRGDGGRDDVHGGRAGERRRVHDRRADSVAVARVADGRDGEVEEQSPCHRGDHGARVEARAAHRGADGGEDGVDAVRESEGGEGRAERECVARDEGSARGRGGGSLERGGDHGAEEGDVDGDVEVREDGDLAERLEEDVQPHERCDQRHGGGHAQRVRREGVDVERREEVVHDRHPDKRDVHLRVDEPPARPAIRSLAEVAVRDAARAARRRSRAAREGGAHSARAPLLLLHEHDAAAEERGGVCRHRSHHDEERHADPPGARDCVREVEQAGAHDDAENVEAGAEC
mmetsp:Transcript_46167/g.150008  ORF Transcript_46167/g.150008 Transcript_46167/m.150008 type:complete len:427 (-) Transcript_46167:337-1617(-)